MKKTLSTLIAIVIVSSLFGCNSENRSTVTPFTFYYRTRDINYNSPDGVIAAETVDLKTNVDDYEHILIQYLKGARSNACISPFPAGTTLEEFSLKKDNARVVLSPHLAMLSDSELVIACICLARTLFDITDVPAVQIYAKDSLLNGEQFITINRDSFELRDICLENSYTD